MRTKNSILNFITSFFPWLILAVLGFVKVKYFIKIFGPELNGLIQLVTQIFNMLSIVSLGFGAATIFHLYKGFSSNNKKQISEIFVGSKKQFKKIGIIVFICGILGSLLVPFIIYNLNISKVYVFLIFFLYSLEYLTAYLIGSPYKVLYEADQKEYKINIVTNTKQVFFRTLELILILNKVNILLIILINVILNIIVNLFLKKLIKKEYKWLNEKAKPNQEPIKMTNDIFVHRINNIIFQNTDAILLSITQGLAIVSIYTSYNFILTYFRQILSFIFKAPKASLGNLFHKKGETDEKKLKVFNEYLSLSFYLSLIIVPIFIVSVKYFISIWISEEYILSTLTVIGFGLILWYEIIMLPLKNIIEVKGEYKNTKKFEWISSICNALLSIALVFKYGILGVVIGTLLTLAFVTHLFYSKYIYKNIFKLQYNEYFKKFIVILLLLLSSILINVVLIDKLNLYQNLNLVGWVVSTGITFIINSLFITSILYLYYDSFKELLYRMIKFRKKSKNVKKNKFI